MPELPEVEAARRAVEENCCNHVIVKACVAEDPKVIDGVSPAALEKALTGRRIEAALRKGKNMWLQLDQPPWPSFQFGMSGAVHIKGVNITKYKRSAVDEEDGWPSKYSKVFFVLNNGLEVSFTDKRRFARVRLLDDPTAVPPISELGPDALLELPDESDFIANLKKKRGSIKAILLDQSFLAGIGNWVADEVLYQAKIHPERTTSNLPEEECKKLHKCIKEVINLAVEVGADSERFPRNWIFHYRWDRKLGKIDGKKIEFITVGGRTSAYVPEVQSSALSHKILKKESECTEDLVSDEPVQKHKKGGKGKKPGNNPTAEPNDALGKEDEPITIKKGRRRKVIRGKTAEKVELTDEGAEEIIKRAVTGGRKVGKLNDHEEADEEDRKGGRLAKQKNGDPNQAGHAKALKDSGRRFNNAKEEGHQTLLEKDVLRQESISAAHYIGTGDVDAEHNKEMVAAELNHSSAIQFGEITNWEQQKLQSQSSISLEDNSAHTTCPQVIQQYMKVNLRISLRFPYPLMSRRQLNSRYTKTPLQLSFYGQGGVTQLLQRHVNSQNHNMRLPCMWNLSRKRHFQISHLGRIWNLSPILMSRSGWFCCKYFLNRVSFPGAVMLIL